MTDPTAINATLRKELQRARELYWEATDNREPLERRAYLLGACDAIAIALQLADGGSWRDALPHSIK